MRYTSIVNDAEFAQLRQELAAAEQKRTAMAHVDLPIMSEPPAPFARRTYTFHRGNWLEKEGEVQPGVPSLFPPLPADSKADRLALARWLVSPDNPLTARVMVNRLWQELFGRGIVETADDFGSSGAAPSHPDLLDDLAIRFERDYAWSMKRLLRAIVLSATYRQDAAATPDKLAKDPQNRLLSRGPRTRLTAEMMRDQALALSGRLSTRLFGPPVMPPQPEGVWRSVYSGAKWVTSTGEDRYRRAVYTYCKRTSGYPSLLAFDMPSRDVCVARRIVTNTPLQALVTMNDEAYIELNTAFAERMEAAGDSSPLQIAAGYRWATGKAIPEQKLVLLTTLYDDAATAFEAQQDAAAELAPSRQRYALAVVANALMNLDEVLTK